MSLSSALFSGISGLSTLGNSMTVIGDNIANVNTVGFKSSRVTFQDVLSQTVATVAGTSQVGRGTSLADITSSFSQGSFETTESTTDLAIGGEGFFVVRDPNNEENQFYSRSGEFRFDKDGNFTSPAGYIVRGWELDATTGEDTGSITDIVLQSFTSSPSKTSKVTLITNLDADIDSKVTDIATVWDGVDANQAYIGEAEYEYQSTLKVYDSLGSTHDITIYFDKGTSDAEYEFIVTCNPEEDNRTGTSWAATDTGRGLLGKGTLTFNQGSGAIEPDGITFRKFIGESGGLSVDTDFALGATTLTTAVYGEWTGSALGDYVFDETTGGGNVTLGGASAVPLNWNGPASSSGTLTIPANYTSGTILGSAAGLPDGIEVAFTFAGATGTIEDDDEFTLTVTAAANGEGVNISSSPQSWATMTTTNDLSEGHFTFSPDFIGSTATSTALSVELDFGSVFNSASASWINSSLSTTQYSSASTTVFQSSDGYGAGDLQSVTVGTDGALTGQYSNGQVIPLYRVALAKFQNNQALFKVGGNLFQETRLSGDPTTSRPGTNGLGSLSPNSLEQSNVDIAQEFVKMITTQRGFQANSKIITVTDQMLAELINIKR